MKHKKIYLMTIIALFIISIASYFLWYLLKNNKVITTLTLDINPSIKLGLNYKNKVVKVEGLNKDGQELIKDIRLEDKTLENAIENITDLAIQKEYITKEDNYILIGVNDNDLQKEVSSLIKKKFAENELECNVISQQINESSKDNAKKYNISESKASYIEEIIKENSNLTFEELKDKSMSEINQIINDKEQNNDKEDENTEDSKVEQKPEDNKQNKPSNNQGSDVTLPASKPNSSGGNKKPVSKPPASSDRTGAWCEFYKTIPPEGGVEYETPGYITDLQKYIDAAKKFMPEDADFSGTYASMTSYTTASYCSCGLVEVENYDKSKTYTAFLDSVTLELLKPITIKELAKPNIDEAGAKVIITKWLLDTYNIDINSCDMESYYYAIDGSTKKPEWQYVCKIDETSKYYSVVVNAITGELSLGRTW